MAPYITKAQFGFNKLWSDDSGRNLAGTQSGTLIGIFPKIILTFRRLSKNELVYLSPHFDSARQTVQYFDPNKNAVTTMTTYTGDYTIVNQRKNINDSFDLSFIAVKKRS